MTTPIIESLTVSGCIISELRDLAGPDQRYVTASTVASCIKTVAALEFGVAVADMPDIIATIYDEASAHPARIYAFDEVARRLEE